MKNNTPLILSVCIPTYNRSDFLIKGLQTWKEIPEYRELEFVIADDHSSDKTVEKINKFKRDNPDMNIIFKSFGKRMYFDKMVLEIVKMSHGKYCWLISDDDLPRIDSIKKIKSIIEKKDNISLIHLNYSRYDNILKKTTSDKMVGDINKDVLFSNPDKFFFYSLTKSYFKFLGTNVITMSTDVVNRKMWISASNGLNKYIGHNFIHCFVILKMIYRNPSIYYISEPVVQYLSNNHRVWPNDIWKDYNNELLGFLKELGYNAKSVGEMQKSQRQFEAREGIMKHPLLRSVYDILKPVYASFLYLRSKLHFSNTQ